VYNTDIQKSYDIAKEINQQASQDFETVTAPSGKEGS